MANTSVLHWHTYYKRRSEEKEFKKKYNFVIRFPNVQQKTKQFLTQLYFFWILLCTSTICSMAVTHGSAITA